MDNNFKIKEKDKFIGELSLKLTSGLANATKNDIIEFLIYLFDKYDTNKTFSKNTNIQNARLFKITPSRVKNIANNIAYKIMDDDEFKELLGKFLLSICDESVSMHDHDNKHFTLSIENPAMAIFLERELKEQKSNYELGRNRELYIVPKEALIKILEKNEQTKKVAKNLKRRIKLMAIKEFTAEMFKEALREALKAMSSALFA